MTDEDNRKEREANEAIKRLELQQSLDGKLNKAYAVEGASILALPAFLAGIGLLCWLLNLLGLEGPAMVFVGVPILIGLVILGINRKQR